MRSSRARAASDSLPTWPPEAVGDPGGTMRRTLAWGALALVAAALVAALALRLPSVQDALVRRAAERMIAAPPGAALRGRRAARAPLRHLLASAPRDPRPPLHGRRRRVAALPGRRRARRVEPARALADPRRARRGRAAHALPLRSHRRPRRGGPADLGRGPPRTAPGLRAARRRARSRRVRRGLRRSTRGSASPTTAQSC